MRLTATDRPWYGSSEKGVYRLDEWDDESGLWKAVLAQAGRPAVMECQGLTYIDSGWEWSVFRHGMEVIKIPAGRFAEVGDPRYIANAERNYRKILKYVDAEFVARTEFCGDHIVQELIESRTWDAINLLQLSSATKSCVHAMISELVALLDQEEWLPDLDLSPGIHGELKLKNWTIDASGIPKLLDFTTYYDVFRLTPSRLKKESPERREALVRALDFVR